jgi:hypothetical protein
VKYKFELNFPHKLHDFTHSSSLTMEMEVGEVSSRLSLRDDTRDSQAPADTGKILTATSNFP